MRSFTVAGPRPLRLGLKVEGGTKTLDLMPGTAVFESWLGDASIDYLIGSGQITEAGKVKDSAVPGEPEGAEVLWEPDTPDTPDHDDHVESGQVADTHAAEEPAPRVEDTPVDHDAGTPVAPEGEIAPIG